MIFSSSALYCTRTARVLSPTLFCALGTNALDAMLEVAGESFISLVIVGGVVFVCRCVWVLVRSCSAWCRYDSRYARY